MCRLGAAVVLRSAGTPAAVTLTQLLRLTETSAGRLLTARTPASVTLTQQLMLSEVSAGRLLTAAAKPSSVTVPQLLMSSDVIAGSCSHILASASSVSDAQESPNGPLPRGRTRSSCLWGRRRLSQRVERGGNGYALDPRRP
jgi:hypothetical protein